METNPYDYYWKIKQAMVRKISCNICGRGLNLLVNEMPYRAGLHLKVFCQHCNQIVYKLPHYDQMRGTQMLKLFDDTVDHMVDELTGYRKVGPDEEAEIIKQGFE